MEVDCNGLEILGRDECLRLLAVARLGRIGFTSGALPSVLPINFRLDGELILVRTGRGTRLDAALRDAVVAFEVDDFDPVDETGWSVAVTGVATEVEAHDRPVTRWAPGGAEVVLAISTELLSGRRVRADSGPRHLPLGQGAGLGTGP